MSVEAEAETLAWYRDFQPYVPVAERRARGAREAAKRMAKGQTTEPVLITGRVIARTFWGAAWCEHLEGYSDFANRLPRGRTYAKNGSIVHLAVEKGRASALVQGTDLYEVSVTVVPLPKARWQKIVRACAGRIDSAVELLQGKLSAAVMNVVTDRAAGLFPAPGEIEMTCSCPDRAEMCKHLAATLYGLGARLDDRPELLFVLRAVNHADLIGTIAAPAAARARRPRAKGLADDELASVFGIDLDAGPAKRPKQRAARVTAPRRPR